MPKSEASEAAVAQELEALKLDMEHVNSRTEEIGVQITRFEGKFTTLTEQMNRLELLLTENPSRTTAAEEERRRVAEAAVATEAQAAAAAKAKALQDRKSVV